MLSSLFRHSDPVCLPAGAWRAALVVAPFVVFLAFSLLGDAAARAACGRYVVFDGLGEREHTPAGSSRWTSRWGAGGMDPFHASLRAATPSGLTLDAGAPARLAAGWSLGRNDQGGDRTAPCDGPRCGGLPMGAMPDSPAPLSPSVPQQWAALLTAGALQPAARCLLPGLDDARPLSGFQREIEHPPRA